MKKKPLYIITDPAFERHDTGGHEHPDVPDRLRVILDRLRKGPLADKICYLAPRPASRKELLSFHTEAWLFRFEEAALSGRSCIDHQDNQVCYESYEIATLAAGAGLVGVDVTESDPEGLAFCAVRPAGHHAEPNAPYGFCFFNNCVIAARYWQNRYGRRRICVLDFDAHHGNGIQTAFEEDAEAAYISIHEHPSFSFPGTGWAEERGRGAGLGTILNLPLPPGRGAERVERELPVVRDFILRFQPDAIVVAAGFDAHREDDMSGLAFTVALYQRLGSFLMELAQECCQGRLLSILEGGYYLEKLGLCVEAYLTGLLNKK